MINGKCFTNLDQHKNTQFPTKFVAVPRIGDRVQACLSGTELKVCSITHAVKKDTYLDGVKTKTEVAVLVPYIIVELNR